MEVQGLTKHKASEIVFSMIKLTLEYRIIGEWECMYVCMYVCMYLFRHHKKCLKYK